MKRKKKLKSMVITSTADSYSLKRWFWRCLLSQFSVSNVRGQCSLLLI